jgi:hypothetical protein
MKIAAIMMQKNEVGLLDEWLAYYSELCQGYDNLYIFDDHSTEPSVITTLSAAKEAGVHIRYNTAPGYRYQDKGRLASDLIRSLDSRYDCYIPNDCDEFICVDSPDGPIIGRNPVVSVIEEWIEEFNRPLLRLNGGFDNVPGKTQLIRQHCKKIVVRSLPPGVVLDYGCHLFNYSGNQRDTVDERFLAPSRLRYIHFHNKPFPLLQECSREKLKGYLADFSRESLLAYRGDSFHVTQHLLRTEVEYLASFASKAVVVPNDVVQGLIESVNAGWLRAKQGNS